MYQIKADFNSKITEVENKIPDVSNLVNKSELTTVENKVPEVNSLVTKANHNTKISEKYGKKLDKIKDHNHDKYSITPEFNTLSARALF